MKTITKVCALCFNFKSHKCTIDHNRTKHLTTDLELTKVENCLQFYSKASGDFNPNPFYPVF